MGISSHVLHREVDAIDEDFTPLRFISEEIEVSFEDPPVITKRPNAPEGFRWQGEQFAVKELLAAWRDYERRGEMSRNMSPAHLRLARQRGSWGVGRFYFRVRTDGGRVFDLYYDRAPEEAGDRAGHWFLWRELEQESG